MEGLHEYVIMAIVTGMTKLSICTVLFIFTIGTVPHPITQSIGRKSHGAEWASEAVWNDIAFEYHSVELVIMGMASHLCPNMGTCLASHLTNPRSHRHSCTFWRRRFYDLCHRQSNCWQLQTDQNKKSSLVLECFWGSHHWVPDLSIKDMMAWSAFYFFCLFFFILSNILYSLLKLAYTLDIMIHVLYVIISGLCSSIRPISIMPLVPVPRAGNNWHGNVLSVVQNKVKYVRIIMNHCIFCHISS